MPSRSSPASRHCVRTSLRRALPRPVRWWSGLDEAYRRAGNGAPIWHPHVPGGRAHGVVTTGVETWDAQDAQVDAEKHWGAGFPKRGWCGQAQGVESSDVCVAFDGGLLTAGPLSITIGGLVVRVGVSRR